MSKLLVIIVLCFAWISGPELSFAQSPDPSISPEQIDPSMLPPTDQAVPDGMQLNAPPNPESIQVPVPAQGANPPTNVNVQINPQPGASLPATGPQGTMTVTVPYPQPTPSDPSAYPDPSTLTVQPDTQVPVENKAVTPPQPLPKPGSELTPPVEEAKPEVMVPYAIVKTTMGSFTIRLHFLKAQKTVSHFIALVKGEKEFIEMETGRKIMRPFYDGLTFHKVVPNFVIQTGCPVGNGTGGPGYTVPDEFDPALAHDKAGVVSMAKPVKEKGDPVENANGSQFFITLGPQPQLDKKYTVFGQVIKGMKVVEKISRVKRGPTDKPLEPVLIESISIDYRKK